MSMRLHFMMTDARTSDGRTRAVALEDVDGDGWTLVRRAWESRDPKLSLANVIWDNFEMPEASVRSRIKENWTLDSLARYVELCNGYGEAYFLLCEALGKRDAESEWDDRGQSFGSFAEVGEMLAEQYLGIPSGALKYLDATRLAKDVRDGEGPLEIPPSVVIMSNPMGNPVYLHIVDGMRDEERPGM